MKYVVDNKSKDRLMLCSNDEKPLCRCGRPFKDMGESFWADGQKKFFCRECVIKGRGTSDFLNTSYTRCEVRFE